MNKVAEVKIVFASGHVETFDVDLALDDDLSPQEWEDGIIAFTKMHCGHGNNEKNLNAMWALMSKSPVASYCVNSKNVDFVSVKVK
jgi:hypothetical protein